MYIIIHINLQTIQSFSHFIFLTWYQSHSSDFLVPVDISGILPLPSPSSSSHCQKRVTIVTPTVPATLGSHCSAHPTIKGKALSDRKDNPEQNPTKNDQKTPHMRLHVPSEDSASRACVISIPHVPGHTASMCPHRSHTPMCLLCFTNFRVSPRVMSHFHVSTRHLFTIDLTRPLTVDC